MVPISAYGDGSNMMRSKALACIFDRRAIIDLTPGDINKCNRIRHSCASYCTYILSARACTTGRGGHDMRAVAARSCIMYSGYCRGTPAAGPAAGVRRAARVL